MKMIRGRIKWTHLAKAGPTTMPGDRDHRRCLTATMVEEYLRSLGRMIARSADVGRIIDELDKAGVRYSDNYEKILRPRVLAHGLPFREKLT
jgi:hypothetical protein